MFKNLWLRIKRIWESEKGQLVEKICNLLDLVKPLFSERIYDKSKGKMNMDTSKGLANDLIEEVKTIVKRQL